MKEKPSKSQKIIDEETEDIKDSKDKHNKKEPKDTSTGRSVEGPNSPDAQQSGEPGQPETLDAPTQPAKPLTVEEKEVLFNDIKQIQHRGVWDKFVKLIKQVKFPSMYGIKGLTHHLQFKVYPVQNDTAQQIFEQCKGSYKTRSHLDRRIYTIGLEWLKIEHLELGCKIDSKLMPVFWAQVEEDRVDEEKAQVLVKYRDYCTKVAQGILSQEEADRRIAKWVKCFPEETQKQLEEMLDGADMGGELTKASHRASQRKYRERKKMMEWETIEGGKQSG